MRTNIDTNKLISKYFSFYFLGKFETRTKSIRFSFVISLIIMIMALVTSLVLSVENTIINILFPFTYMGTIGNLVMINKLKSNIKNGIEGYEKKMFQSDSTRRTYETSKINTFLSTISLFMGMIDMIFASNIVTFLIILALEMLTLYTLTFTGNYKEENKNKKMLTTLICLTIIAIVSVLLRLKGLNTLISGNYIIILTLMFAFVSYMKATSFVNYLFKKEKTNGYIVAIDNYDNLKKENKTKESSMKNNSSSTTNIFKSIRSIKKNAGELKEFCKKNYEENQKIYGSTSSVSYKQKEASTGYSVESLDKDDETSRFLARNKR